MVYFVLINVWMQPDELLVHGGCFGEHPKEVVAVAKEGQGGPALRVELQLLFKNSAGWFAERCYHE